jgi:DNA-binding transcriptional MerR regulator
MTQKNCLDKDNDQKNVKKNMEYSLEKQNKAFEAYFTTGEFARLCKVKKQTLFHYDEIGIFSPEIKKENGYRYYSYNQLEVFQVISVLKEMDMPLKNIKEYLNHRSPEDLIDLLSDKIREIDRKMEDLNWLKNMLKTKVRLTQDARKVTTGTVLTEELLEDEHFITTPYNDTEDAKKMTQAIAGHLNLCHDLDIYSAYSIGGMIPTSKIPNETDYNYSHFYTKLSGSEIHAANHKKPRGRYAVIYHWGGFDTAIADYAKLTEYVAAEGFSMGAFFYEDVILDELSMKGYDNYVLKISVRLKKMLLPD